MAVDMRRDGSVAIVTLANPPVNAIGLGVRQGIEAALDWVDAQQDLTHVVLTGAGRAFAAGADAKEFDAPPVAPHLPELIARIEACAVPWVAAINGVALGGGCELTLGCRMRLAHPKAQIGLPEVTLGVVPGAGGTQRLPRLVGMAQALHLISTGKPLSAEQAKDIGLVDALADDPVQAAIALDPAELQRVRAVSARPAPMADPDAVSKASAHIDRRMSQQIAPQEAIALVAAASEQSVTDGQVRERETFLRLRQGSQARALRHAFFAERAAKPPAGLQEGSADLARVAIVGGGTMGAGIAYAALNAGVQVVLIEADDAGLSRAQDNIDRILSASQTRGLIDADGALARRRALTLSTDYGAAAGCGLAIEAAFESMEVKQQVFAALESALPDDAILATNTSYLDVDRIAATLADPSRVVGLHFFAPAHIMKLLEIVRGAASSDRALATGYALAKRLRKVPVVSGVCDGFIGNRILARYREAADTVLMDGATPWQIDAAMTGFGYAMGPYGTNDLSGLDIGYATRRRQDATRDPARRYIPIADRMVEQGRLGRKTRAGWYLYSDDGGKTADSSVTALILDVAQEAGVARRDFSQQEIQERMLAAMVNEAAAILEEGIAASARDVDLVTLLGYGFPRWRGGLMHWAQTEGLANIVARIEAYHLEDPVAWRLSPALRRAADQGRFGD